MPSVQTAVPVNRPERPRHRHTRLPQGLAAFQHRNYRLFFFGQFVSVTGTWMQSLAQSWLVLSLTSSPLRLGLVNVFQFAPVLALGLLGGVAADRYSKRNLLVATQTAAGVLAGVLALLVATDQVRLWHVYVLALCLGVVNAFDMPTRQSFVVEMVGREDLVNAVALNSAVFNAARIVGPAIGGVLLAAVGVAICFTINAISYLAVIAGLMLMRLDRRRPASRIEGVGRIREGLAYVRATPVIFTTVVMVGFVATFGMNFQIWVPLLAKREFTVGAGGFGVLMSALGAGSLLGALALAFLGKRARWGVMLGTATALGVVEILLAIAGAIPLSIAVALVLLPILGFSMTMTMSMANSTVQAAAPDHLRGRIMSVYMTVFAGTVPFGALLVGAIANAFGTPASIAVGGTITVAAALCVLWRTYRSPARLLDPIRSAAPTTSSRIASSSRPPSSATGED